MRKLVVVGLLLGAFLLARGSRGAANQPSTIARGLPAGAVAYVESERLGALVAAWRDSPARQRFDGSSADASMRRSMLFLRLAERVAELEALAGFELDFDRAAALFGREAGLAVYDLADTRFVLVTRLTDAQLGKTPLEAARKRLAPRRHAGLEYFVAEKAGGVLAFAQVGDRLLVGNDLAHFREALVLTAREAKVKTDAAPGRSLADDDRLKTLLADAPAEAAARVFVDLARLRGTHYFDDFWFFHWASGAKSARVDGIAASLLSIRFDKSGMRENRRHLMSDPGRLAGLADQAEEKDCAGLPPGLLVSTGVGAPRVSRLLLAADPRGEWSNDDRQAMEKAHAELDAELGKLLPGPWLETVDIVDGRGRGAIAVRVSEGFDLAALEKVILISLRASLGQRLPLAFAAGPNGSRQLVVPLVGDWRLTLVPPRPDTPWVWVASDESAIPQKISAALLAPTAPRCARAELASAGKKLAELTHAVAGGPLADAEHRALLAEIAPALLAAPGISQVTTVTFRMQSVLVEDAYFRW